MEASEQHHTASVSCPSTASFLTSSQNCEKRLLASSRLSAHMEQFGSHWAHLNETWCLSVFREYAEKIQVSLKFDGMTGTPQEDRCTFSIISRGIIRRMRNVSGKVVQKIKTHVLCSVTFPRKSCLLWDNVEKCERAGQATDGNITWRMRFACWVTKATGTHYEYVILIAVPRHQWLRERPSVLRCKYSACPVEMRPLALSQLCSSGMLVDWHWRHSVRGHRRFGGS